MATTFADYCKQAKIDTSEMQDVAGHYDEIKDWVMDPKGYFLIRVNREARTVEAGFCPKTNKVTVKLTGAKPQDIWFQAITMGLVSRLDHAAYLGKELEKAFFALRHGLAYEQDAPLELAKA